MSSWQSLVKGLVAKTSPHAWCIIHPLGVSASELTDHFIRVLLCQNLVNWVPCEDCMSCRIRESHPDLTSLEPEGVAGMIKVDAVRDMINVAYTTASLGGRRVILIRPAECLNQSSSNALLKVVEEPPSGTVFIFQTALPGRIPPTLLSRLRMVRIPSLLSEELRGMADLIKVEMSEIDMANALLAEPAASQSDPKRYQLAKDVLGALDRIRRGEDSQIIVNNFAKADAMIVSTVMGRVCEHLISAHFGRLSNPVAQLMIGPYPPIAMLYQLREKVEEVRRQAQSGIAVNSGLAFGSLFAVWKFIWSRV